MLDEISLNVRRVANGHDIRQCFGCTSGPKPANLRRTELTRNFKACLSFLFQDALQRVVDIVFAMFTARSIHRIRRSQQMEGGGLTPFARCVFERYINADITRAEVCRQLKNHHGLGTA